LGSASVKAVRRTLMKLTPEMHRKTKKETAWCICSFSTIILAWQHCRAKYKTKYLSLIVNLNNENKNSEKLLEALLHNISSDNSCQ